MSRRRGILIGLIGLVIVVFGVLVVQASLGRATAAPPRPTLAPPPTVRVLVTTHAISLRARLTPEDLKMIDVPVDLAPPGGLSETALAVGKITKVPLAAGEMVLAHHLADPTNTPRDLGFVIGDDQVVMAFPATDLMSQINLLQPGDLVDILASIEVPVEPPAVRSSGSVVGPESEAELRLFTFSALQRVTIQAVVVDVAPPSQRTSTSTASRTAQATPAPTPTPAPSQIEARAILLALSPQDALVLKHLLDAGGVIDIVLRAPTSTQLFELHPVMSEYLKDRYELHPPR